jgi:hypothetical protein
VSAAFALYVGATLPARRVALSGSIPPSVVVGGYHIHSTRSDGTGTPDAIASAAARAGLQFIILTDHGSGTRVPDPPAYRQGVLVLDAVEISTSGGHVVALQLASAAPYPLAGEARDVVEDIHRLGGWAFVAHPDSPKAELRWTAWDVPYDGIEWINADSEWRDEPSGRLAMTVVRSFVRGPEAIASLFARPDRTIARWDGVTRRRPVVAVGALDAHAHLPWPEDGRPRQASALALPSYAEMFGTLAQAVTLDRPLSGDAATDAGRVLDAVRGGRTFTVLRAVAGPAVLEFSATRADATAGMGDRLERSGVETTFRAAVPGVSDARVALVQNGREVRAGKGSVTYTGTPPPGAYRVEVTYPGVAMPWIFSNPIYIGPAGPPARLEEPAAGLVHVTPLPSPGPWAIERQPASTGTVTTEGEDLRFAYELDSGGGASPFAALVSPVTGDEGVRQIEFVGHADRPMRLSVQVRLLGGRDDRRWQRSVYLDDTPRHIVIRVSDLEPTGSATSLRPTVAIIRSLLFVVDTLNTLPGARGTVWLSKVALGGG